MKPTIKYLLVEKSIGNMYLNLHVMYFISYKHMTYDILYNIYYIYLC
jgi:hypothetical protein